MPRQLPTQTTITRTDDGKLLVKLETGETFLGTPAEVIRKMADSKAHTTKEYLKRTEELAQLKAENTGLKSQLNTPPNFRSTPAQPQTPPAPPVDARDKLSRDFYGTEYNKLPPEKQADVSVLNGGLVNDAPDHPYLKSGLTFIQARHLLIETYREELSNSYPEEIKTALIDFRSGLEKDLSEAAKRAGFYPEYSRANHDLKTAARSMPMAARR
jgi:hypothetical protein